MLHISAAGRRQLTYQYCREEMTFVNISVLHGGDVFCYTSVLQEEETAYISVLQEEDNLQISVCPLM